MNKQLLESVVDLDAPEPGRDVGGNGRDVHDARTAIARVPEGFLDCLREPGFTSHEASTRPRAGAVLWALEELENAPPPAPPVPPPLPVTAKPPPLPRTEDGPEVAPEIEILATSTERPPFTSLPEIDIGAAITELRRSVPAPRKAPLPTWLSVLILAAAAATTVVGWVAVVMRVMR